MTTPFSLMDAKRPEITPTDSAGGCHLQDSLFFANRVLAGALLLRPLMADARTILIQSGAKNSKIEEAHRQLAPDFWREFFKEMKTEFWPKYLSADIVNYDPYEPSGGQAFADCIKGNNAKFNRKAGPEKERLFVLADGDLVMVV